ncbi:MAG: hypothetical protein ICV79_13620 [Flavisolibacter sp.]|nr:hypothetical protein [Flavisolibacter sp.]
MGTVVRIPKNSSKEAAKKMLEAFSKKQQQKSKSLRDYFGALPGAFGDGLQYQRKLRDEWE